MSWVLNIQGAKVHGPYEKEPPEPQANDMPPLSCMVSSDVFSNILSIRRTWAKSEMPMVAVSPSTFTHSWELL